MGGCKQQAVCHFGFPDCSSGAVAALSDVDGGADVGEAASVRSSVSAMRGVVAVDFRVELSGGR